MLVDLKTTNIFLCPKLNKDRYTKHSFIYAILFKDKNHIQKIWMWFLFV